MAVFMTGGKVLSKVNVTVKASDSSGYLSAVLAAGALLVGEYQITNAETDLTLSSKEVEISMTMTSALSKARTVTVNGTSIGSVKAVGSSVSTTLTVANGDVITIVFSQ